VLFRPVDENRQSDISQDSKRKGKYGADLCKLLEKHGTIRPDFVVLL